MFENRKYTGGQKSDVDLFVLKERKMHMPGYPDMSKGEGLIRTYDLLDHLIGDVHKAFEALEAERASQYLRRCAARAVIAFVEGIVQIVKWEVASDLRMGRYSRELSKKDREVLYEEKVVNGERFMIRIPVDENIKKTFRMAATVWKLGDYVLDADGPDYQDFLRAKEARNRLTHPRTYYDVEVTDFDMHCYAATFLWARRSFSGLFRKKVESIAADLPEDAREALLSRELSKGLEEDPYQNARDPG